MGSFFTSICNPTHHMNLFDYIILCLECFLLENAVGGSWACQFCPILAKNSGRQVQ
jgi:hypothetical protein